MADSWRWLRVSLKMQRPATVVPELGVWATSVECTAALTWVSWCLLLRMRWRRRGFLGPPPATSAGAGAEMPCTENPGGAATGGARRRSAGKPGGGEPSSEVESPQGAARPGGGAMAQLPPVRSARGLRAAWSLTACSNSSPYVHLTSLMTRQVCHNTRGMRTNSTAT